MTDDGRLEKTGSGWVVGVGSALMDILSREEDGFLDVVGATKGGMRLVEMAAIDNALSLVSAPPVMVPGGSACNTVVGVAQLGGRARFVGKCGRDDMGQRLLEGLRQCRVAPELTRSQTPTGRVLSIITPDAQRSFLTCLGAAAESQHEDLLPGHFHGAAIVHLEGYLLYNEPLIMAALEHAKAAGALISIDFASFTVVAEARALLTRIVEQYADIVLANEDEARTFAETDDEMAALEVLSRRAKIAVVKLGARGSCIRHGAVTTVVAPLGDGAAVDTTGAGDLWAAGFLYGLVNGLDMAQSGALGSACGYEVCQVVGATIPEAGWQRIRRLLESFTMK